VKFIVMLLALAGVAALALPREVLAQRADAFSRVYDLNTIETVSGRVLAVQRVAGSRRGSYGEHLILKTRTGRLVVHLGPEWFMQRQTLQIKLHDELIITGSRVLLGGRPVLIAARISKARETLVLRDAQGLPVWRGSRNP
jgi:hypothetical protein